MQLERGEFDGEASNGVWSARVGLTASRSDAFEPDVNSSLRATFDGEASKVAPTRRVGRWFYNATIE